MFTILAVDDANFILCVLEEDLEAHGYKVLKAKNGEVALEILNQENIDLILLDLYMPGLSGLEVLQKVKTDTHTQNIPVIMLSGSDNEDSIVAALDIGADDYITKPYIPEVFQARIRTSLRLLEKTRLLEKMASTDFLTGINNRRHFSELVSPLIGKTKRQHTEMVFAMLDIDKFKQVNDRYGHDSGDKVLLQFALTLQQSFRDYDIIGRLGGEEFAVCMPETGLEEGLMCCDRFRKSLQSTDMTLDHPLASSINITVSIGISVTNAQNENQDLDTLLQEADQALYVAKENGRNQVAQATTAMQ
ncbi:MAG: diguanylate cyclase [Pseudomonadales bacterium]|nr:diguanylate cyclase [Pseudomonadales bacterium]